MDTVIFVVNGYFNQIAFIYSHMRENNVESILSWYVCAVVEHHAIDVHLFVGEQMAYVHEVDNPPLQCVVVLEQLRTRTADECEVWWKYVVGTRAWAYSKRRPTNPSSRLLLHSLSVIANNSISSMFMSNICFKFRPL
jgi:hypothetical protein